MNFNECFFLKNKSSENTYQMYSYARDLNVTQYKISVSKLLAFSCHSVKLLDKNIK
jgi:hypothetical protein